jgi:hypothetical protein
MVHCRPAVLAVPGLSGPVILAGIKCKLGIFSIVQRRVPIDPSHQGVCTLAHQILPTEIWSFDRQRFDLGSFQWTIQILVPWVLTVQQLDTRRRLRGPKIGVVTLRQAILRKIGVLRILLTTKPTESIFQIAAGRPLVAPLLQKAWFLYQQR